MLPKVWARNVDAWFCLVAASRLPCIFPATPSPVCTLLPSASELLPYPPRSTCCLALQAALCSMLSGIPPSFRHPACLPPACLTAQDSSIPALYPHPLPPTTSAALQGS